MAPYQKALSWRCDRLVQTLAGCGSHAQRRNKDGVAHYPGWSLEVLKYLCEERKITASGHETTDTDPGIATSRRLFL